LIYTTRDNENVQWWSIRNGGKLIFNKIRKNWFTLQETMKMSNDDQFKMLKLQTHFRCFLVCFLMVQVMLGLWSLFIEFWGSYSRFRVSNGVMSCVLGPTNFYLKFWVNILIIGCTLECCCVFERNPKILLCSWWSSSGFMMNGWTHEFHGTSYAFHMIFLTILMSCNFFTNI